ncbi:hypothetical protein [Vibrio agarivorans]|uniref:hypothetical protein n=1 Tax=Vibrio agarivorans TaxID=153622 RepID=UPI0025B36CD7|nr:hypothetical protein [Vibrio agarivorans]MDN3662214.1 hypothetical protein [Vibrio agarivorans]
MSTFHAAICRCRTQQHTRYVMRKSVRAPSSLIDMSPRDGSPNLLISASSVTAKPAQHCQHNKVTFDRRAKRAPFRTDAPATPIT